MLIANAMRATGSEDPLILKDYLGKLTTYQGASGNLMFDGKRGVTKQHRLLVIKGDYAVPIV